MHLHLPIVFLSAVLVSARANVARRGRNINPRTRCTFLRMQTLMHAHTTQLGQKKKSKLNTKTKLKAATAATQEPSIKM
jgi:hypothetical protein